MARKISAPKPPTINIEPIMACQTPGSVHGTPVTGTSEDLAAVIKDTFTKGLGNILRGRNRATIIGLMSKLLI
jgi:hypothetical protein